MNGYDSFEVSKSLHSALRRLRQRNIPIPVWVDAICVNQADTLERTRQVSMMSSIYQMAEVVWVWLGPCQDRHCRRSECQPCQGPCSGCSLTNEQRLYRCAFLSTTFANLVDFGQKMSWWWRTWTVLEVGVARDVRVLLGSHQIPWRKFLEVIQLQHIQKDPNLRMPEATQRFLERDSLRRQLHERSGLRSPRLDMYALLKHT